MSMRTVVALSAAAALAFTAVASASAPPVGPLPAGPVTQVTAPKGTLVAVALPAKSGGLVWRLARPYDAAVVRQVSEATVGRNVVIVFRAVGKGSTRIVFGLTRGERTHAYASVAHVVEVR